jgi:urocanate hydratase
MLFWDVNNGISRRSWAHVRAVFCDKKSHGSQPLLKVTLPNIVADNLLDF